MGELWRLTCCLREWTIPFCPSKFRSLKNFRQTRSQCLETLRSRCRSQHQSCARQLKDLRATREILSPVKLFKFLSNVAAVVASKLCWLTSNKVTSKKIHTYFNNVFNLVMLDQSLMYYVLKWLLQWFRSLCILVVRGKESFDWVVQDVEVDRLCVDFDAIHPPPNGVAAVETGVPTTVQKIWDEPVPRAVINYVFSQFGLWIIKIDRVDI